MNNEEIEDDDLIEEELDESEIPKVLLQLSLIETAEFAEKTCPSCWSMLYIDKANCINCGTAYGSKDYYV